MGNDELEALEPEVKEQLHQDLATLLHRLGMCIWHHPYGGISLLLAEDESALYAPSMKAHCSHTHSYMDNWKSIDSLVEWVLQRTTSFSTFDGSLCIDNPCYGCKSLVEAIIKIDLCMPS